MIYIINADMAIYRRLFYCGLILSFLLTLIIARRNKITIKESLYTIVSFIIGGFIGAKIFYLFIYKSTDGIKELIHPRIINSFVGGRYLFYGGIFGGVVIFYALKLIMGERILYIVRNYIFIVPLVHGFSRLGFMFVGCYYGVHYNGYFSLMYKSSKYAPLNISLFPIQPLEAILNIILAIILFQLAYKKVAKYNIYVYLMVYTFERFVLENFRGDKISSFIGFLSLAQVISIFIFTVTVSIFIIKKYSGGINYTKYRQ